jgi:hypothetical protein
LGKTHVVETATSVFPGKVAVGVEDAEYWFW